MDRETFDKAVDFAEEIIRENFGIWRGDLGRKKVRAYEVVSRPGRRDDLGQEFADYLRREFIRESEHSGASWDAVNELAAAALDKGPLTRDLRCWARDVLRDQLLKRAERSRPRPTRGRNGDNYHARDVAFGEAVRRLIKPPWQLDPTRNITRGDWPSHEGGSACDVAGRAWNRLSPESRDGMKKLRLKAFIRIWGEYKKGTGKNLDNLETLFPEGGSARDAAGMAPNPLSDEYRDQMEQQEREAFKRIWDRYMKSKGENVNAGVKVHHWPA